jgi:hypothetical protein
LDFNKQLKLEGLDKPVGDAAIEKGATLTDAEGKEAVVAFAAARQSARGR